MKITDFNEVFGEHKASTALLSTFDFDPLYFEHRLLWSDALQDARRIMILMDAGRYKRLARADSHARYLNDRYLLVPVSAKGGGVFHPKLHLLAHKDGATVFCGSNNLTQAGCTNNLELINAVRVSSEKDDPRHRLAEQALGFFETCISLCNGPWKRLAETWLKDLQAEMSWLGDQRTGDTAISLVHSLSESLWERFRSEVGKSPLKRILVISPFYDKDLALLTELRKEWPQCPVEIVAQEHTSNLPAKLLGRYRTGVKLYGIEVPNSRRLHAKLVLFETRKETICFAGSANFTSAAFKGRNVEACLVIRGNGDVIASLFDEQLQRKRIKPNQFESGSEEEPAPDPGDKKSVVLEAAVLDQSGRLALQYNIKEPSALEKLSIAFQKYGEEKPSKVQLIPLDSGGARTIQMDAATCRDLHGSVRCFLIAQKTNGEREQSDIVWLIQEHHLTHEPAGNGGTNNPERIVQETGRGTTEFLDLLAEREGYLAVVEFLDHLNIKYQSDLQVPRGHGGYGWRANDPTLPDAAPGWVHGAGRELEKAIFDFVDRHHKRILQKHARSGNINGLANFLDVFIECNKLLFLYFRRGKVNPLFAMEKILRAVGIFTDGYSSLGNASHARRDEDDDPVEPEPEYEGYFQQMLKQLSGYHQLVSKAAVESRALEHLCIGLFMAQLIRCLKDDPGKAKDFHLKYHHKVLQIVKALRTTPTAESLKQALAFYPFLSEEERNQWPVLIREELPK
jgi:HKD family nuclease